MDDISGSCSCSISIVRNGTEEMDIPCKMEVNLEVNGVELNYVFFN